MQKSSKSLMAILMVVLILGVAYFGYGQWTKLGEARTAFEASKTQNEKLKQAHADASAFLSKYENNRQEALLANRALPLGKPQVPVLLDNYTKLAADSGLGLSMINITEGEKTEAAPEPGSIQSVEVNLQLRGTYEALTDFLLRTQRSLRLMDLISFNISDDQEAENGSGNLNFTLRLRTYYQQ